MAEAKSHPQADESHPAVGNPPMQLKFILNGLLSQGRDVIDTVLDPVRLRESLQNTIPGCQPATYDDLAGVISRHAHASIDPLVRPT
jgi:hypothetical protein